MFILGFETRDRTPWQRECNTTGGNVVSGTTIRGAVPEHYLKLMSKADRAALGKGGLSFEEACAKYKARAEREFQNQIGGLLSLHEIVFNRSRMDKRKTDKVGWPDFTFAVRHPDSKITGSNGAREPIWSGPPGLPIAWEAKMPGEVLDDDQVECIGQMEQCGWIVRTVFTIADCVKHLRELKVIK